MSHLTVFLTSTTAPVIGAIVAATPAHPSRELDVAQDNSNLATAVRMSPAEDAGAPQKSATMPRVFAAWRIRKDDEPTTFRVYLRLLVHGKGKG